MSSIPSRKVKGRNALNHNSTRPLRFCNVISQIYICIFREAFLGIQNCANIFKCSTVSTCCLQVKSVFRSWVVQLICEITSSNFPWLFLYSILFSNCWLSLSRQHCMRQEAQCFIHKLYSLYRQNVIERNIFKCVIN